MNLGPQEPHGCEIFSLVNLSNETRPDPDQTRIDQVGYSLLTALLVGTEEDDIRGT